ncbi:MAG TPA: AAA family ATPase [Negativicutes bacterium]|jgi:pilus assembly protein CpaE
MTSPKIKVMVISKDEELRLYLAQLFLEEQMFSEDMADVEQALTQMQTSCPDVILLDAALEIRSIAEVVTQCQRRCADSRLVGIISAGNGELGRTLQLQGIADYVVKPLDDIEIVQTIHRVLAKKTEPFLTKASVAAVPADKQTKIITFFSPISGAGKTVLALNLATALARQGAGKVCIIDADLQFGDVARYLCYSAKYTVADYAAAFSQGASIWKYVSCWNQGVDLLVAPVTIKQAELVTPLILSAAVKELSRYYQYIVVDTTAGFNEWTLSMLDLSSTVFFVSTVEHVPSVRKVRIGLDILHSLGYGKERIKLLLNRDNAKKGLDLRQVEEALETKFQMKIANDYEAVVRSLLDGVPFVETQPERVVSRQLNELAAHVTGNTLDILAPKNWLVRKLANWF